MNLHNADCLDKLKDLEDGSVDLICCDLPYGQTGAKWDSKIDLNDLWIQLKRIRKDTTPIFMFGTLKFGLELIASNAKEFKYELVWDKTSRSNFLLARKRPMSSHEYVFVFYKKQPFYDLSSHMPERTSNFIEKSKDSPLFGSVKNIHGGHIQYNPRLPTQIVQFSKKRNKINSTAKPIDLLKWILKYYSKENDTVLDPTMGSGTMVIACNQMNRKAIGIEKDKEMYDKAVEFINTFV